MDLADALAVLLHLFTGDYKLPCAPLADADGNGRIELTDAVALLEYLFLGGAAPVELTPEEAEACR